MNRTDFFLRIYAIILRLYPSQFRSVFEEEMQTVFAAKAVDWAREGLAVLSAACLREYFDLLRNLFGEYIPGFGEGGDMSLKGRIIFILVGCSFLAGGIFPWASLFSGDTLTSYKGPNETLLYLTGGIILAAGLFISRKFTKITSILASVIGLGWGAYLGLGLVSYFTNPPHFAQSSDYLNFGPGLFLTLGASILLVSFGLFQLISMNKHSNNLTIPSK
jgi:hypothetical protein